MASSIIFYTTGTQHYATVATRRGSSISYSQVVHSTALEIELATEELLDQLQTDCQKKLPKNTILITPSAMGGLLNLPVNPSKPRPAAQMAELIRWDLEEILGQQSSLWSTGALLQSRGVLTVKQRQEIEEEASLSRVYSAANSLYQEAVTKEQYEECLALQEQLTPVDEELIIGWSPLTKEVTEDGFAWNCIGISDPVRKRWVNALSRHNRECSWIYPQLGGSYTLIASPDKKSKKIQSDNIGDTPFMLIDLAQEKFELFQGTRAGINFVSSHRSSHGEVTAALIAEAVERHILPEVKVIYISCDESVFPEFAQLLESTFSGIKVRPTPTESQYNGDKKFDCPHSVMLAIQGVALHALKVVKKNLQARIEGKPPGPPVWKNRQLWPWFIIGLLVFCFIGNEVRLYIKATATERELSEMDIEFERRKMILKTAQEEQAKARALQKKLEQKEAELTAMHKQVEILNNVIRYRQILVPGILSAIGEAVTDDMALDIIDEDEDRAGFYLEGWALTESEAQRFGDRLNKALANWQYKVKELQTTLGKGRYGIDGFILKIRLIKFKGVTP